MFRFEKRPILAPPQIYAPAQNKWLVWEAEDKKNGVRETEEGAIHRGW